MGTMKNRWLIATGLVLGLAGPLRASEPPYPSNFGLSSGLFATGSTISVSYYGWEGTTYYGHTLYAMTTGQYASDFSHGCFSFYAAGRTSCQSAGGDLGALLGTSLFTKPFGVHSDPYLPTPQVANFGWTQFSEIVFALRVYQGDGTANDNPGAQYNWFFSGGASRNVDNYAHLALFSSDLYPSGVPTYGNQFVPGTQGLSLYGFEDVNHNASDWDFNNALFALDGTGGPTDIVPEPVTLTLLATGLAGLGALRRRRRRSDSAPG